MSNDNLHPVFKEYFDNLLSKPSEPAEPEPDDFGLVVDPAEVCADLGLDPIFGEVIYSYSRAEAIEDGTLVDLGYYKYRGRPILEQAGIRYPMAITPTAFGAVCAGQTTAEDELQALTEFCLAFKDAVRRMVDGADLLQLTFRGAQLKAICGPGDDAEPVITIMLPDED
jgi:hypothetical protein